jgi:hypothetical protein
MSAPSRVFGLICTVSLLAAACGKSTPTSPSGSNNSTGIINTYVAELNLPGGVTGTLQLRASTSLGSLQPRNEPMLARLLAWIEPAVAAQSSSATGLLVTSSGTMVPLSGTYSNGTFNVSGAGYTIVAQVASTPTGTSISGTATVPGGGSVPVTAPAPLPVTGPPPANPVGTYVGTYQIVTTGSLINRRISDNNVEQNCVFNVVINGSLSLRLFNVLPNGLTQSELTSSWTESATANVSPTCGVGPANSWGTISPGSGIAGFEGPATSLVYGHAGSIAMGQGTNTRAEAYLGTVSGDTVVMKVSRSFQFASSFTSVTAGPITSVMGYPTASVTTTLTKQ